MRFINLCDRIRNALHVLVQDSDHDSVLLCVLWAPTIPFDLVKHVLSVFFEEELVLGGGGIALVLVMEHTHTHMLPWAVMIVTMPFPFVHAVLHLLAAIFISAAGEHRHWDREAATDGAHEACDESRACGHTRSGKLGPLAGWLAEVDDAGEDPEDHGEGPEAADGEEACAIESPQDHRLAIVFRGIHLNSLLWQAGRRSGGCGGSRRWVLHGDDGAGNDLLIHRHSHLLRLLVPSSRRGERQLLSCAKSRFGHQDLKLHHWLRWLRNHSGGRHDRCRGSWLGCMIAVDAGLQLQCRLQGRCGDSGWRRDGGGMDMSHRWLWLHGLCAGCSRA